MAVQPPTLERCPVAVYRYRKLELLLCNRLLHFRKNPSSAWLWMVDANYLKAGVSVGFLKFAQCGRGSRAQIAAIRPPTKQHHFPSQIGKIERLRIDPVSQVQRRRWMAD